MGSMKLHDAARCAARQRIGQRCAFGKRDGRTPRSTPAAAIPNTTSNTQPSRNTKRAEPTATAFRSRTGISAPRQTYRPRSRASADLTPGTIYHWRVVASNVTGTTYGPDRTFTTFPFVPVLEDSCANVHVRQQTGAGQLLDCRAYELVSAANTAGYDVESDLVPNQSPYPGYPDAEAPSRVLYAVHDGGIPGTDHPTNRGPDPYVATRNAETGWSTEYVGVPANNPFSAAPFSSIPSGASADLETLAFGGPGGCSPCFEGGYTGIPVRLPDGSLVQGMSGPARTRAPPPTPTATSPRTSRRTANTSSSAPPRGLPKAATAPPAMSRSTTTT